ncbi:hypothetical protein KIS1582_4399 [Cytobacillus firmus]|uniref:Uncharacterized protein n=1 Tax=Cytobacillus firmus TaxID=1399 RepID=A0A800MSS8_CYTFI|nr:hypothetical protein KIS1582_4399 [Cytobacillus firmus]
MSSGSSGTGEPHGKQVPAAESNGLNTKPKQDFNKEYQN